MKMHNIHPRNRRKEISTKTVDTQRISTIVGVTIIILAPIAYLIGTYYYYGYLNTFGVDPSHFPASTQETYIYAYQALTTGLAKSTDVILNTLKENVLFIFITFFLSIPLFYLLIHKKTEIIKKYLKKNWTNLLSPDKTDKLALATTLSFILLNLIFSILYLYFCIAIIALLAGSIPYNLGKSAANKSISTYLKSGCHYEKNFTWNNCTAIMEENKIIYEGISIIENKEKIAIFNASGTKIIPNSANYVITRNYQR
jgi:hypothetical protein